MIVETPKLENAFLTGFESARAAFPAQGPPWFQELRESGLEAFRTAGFPGRTDEAWRFTNLKPLGKKEFSVFPGTRGAVPELPASFAGDDPVRLVFVDGVPVSGLSEGATASDVPDMCSLLQAGSTQSELVQSLLGQLVDIERHPFSALNTGFLDDGAFLRVPPGWSGRPIHLLFINSGTEPSRASFPRVLVAVGDGAEVVLIEEFAGAGAGSSFTSGVTELSIGKNASLEHIRLQRETPETFHIGSVTARLDRDSRFTGHVVSLGGRLARVDVDVVLAGEGAEATLNGLYLLDGKQHMDHHTHVDHAVPHTSSRELYQGVLDGKATAVFNGRVLIRSDAQKVEAEQSNNNLLLSEGALVNTNPELEIFADDVKAQHGATIGQIDDDHLFYLRSRGIEKESARKLLIAAFAARMIDRIPLATVREDLATTLEQRF